MGVQHKVDSVKENALKRQQEAEKKTKSSEQAADTDAMLTDFEYRLTLLELGLEVN